MSRAVLALLVVARVLGATGTPVIAQEFGELTGIVVDGQGAAIAGATVTATAINGQDSSATSDATGRYQLRLPPATYRVRATRAGAISLVYETVTVEPSGSTHLDLVVSIGAVAEVVRVQGALATERPNGPGLGRTLDAPTVASLPLNGRNLVALVATVPGVALPPGSLLPRINGGRPRTNEYVFDGISVRQPEPGQVPFVPIVDAVREMTVETNSPPPQLGRFSGGAVVVTTRAGTDVLHGTAFDFVRHEALNARPPFTTDGTTPRFRREQAGGVLGGPLLPGRTFFFADYQRQRQAIGRTVISTVPTALQRQGIFTETVGGRLVDIYDPASTARDANGAFTRTAFANRAIPVERMDPLAVGLISRYPLPTRTGTANNFVRTGDETVDHDHADVRIDQTLGTTWGQTFVKLTRFRETFAPVTPLPEGSGTPAGTLGLQRATSWAVATNHRRPFESGWMSEVRVGDTRRAVERDATRLATTASRALGLSGLPTTSAFADTLPTFLVAGYQHLGSPAGTASDSRTSVTQLVGLASRATPRHSITLGGDLRWERIDILQPASPTGAFTFTSLFTDMPGVAGTGSALASFLLGQVQQFSIDLQQEMIQNRARSQEYFVRDEWRMASRVTLDAGLRYTLNMPSTERRDQAAVFDLDTERLRYLGRADQPRSARQLHWGNIGPRLSLAVRVTPTTVARLGYGMVWIDQAGITSPFTTPAFPFVQTVSQRTLDNVRPAFTLANGSTVAPVASTADAGLGQGVFAVDRDLGSGYVQQWHASLHRDLRSGPRLEVAYVGSKMTRAGVPDANINQLSVEQLQLGGELLARVPNPYFGVIPASSSLGEPTIPIAQLMKPYPRFTTVSQYRNNVGTTIYHGLSALLEQRVGRSFTYSAAYTRSRLVDDASAVFDASLLAAPLANSPVADAYNRRLERDVSTGDIPHVLVGTFAWTPWRSDRSRARWPWLDALGHDWTVSGVVTAQSGTPIAVTQATNNNAFAGFGIQRPTLVGEPKLPRGQRSAARWFDTTAFTETPQFALGTSSRNPVRGPGYQSVDVALSRRVALGDRTSLEMRAEAFNLLNTTQLGQPNGVLGTPAFGTITTAGDPRVVQLAAKLSF